MKSALLSSVLMLTLSGTCFAQDWTEFSSREDRFSITFPGEPQMTDTTWISQYQAILPGHIYSGRQGSTRYTVTVIDYNPIERLLTERSRTLPALDLAVHEYGPGYWKTDVRGAVVFAASKYLERDAKITSERERRLLWIGGEQFEQRTRKLIEFRGRLFSLISQRRFSFRQRTR